MILNYSAPTASGAEASALVVAPDTSYYGHKRGLEMLRGRALIVNTLLIVLRPLLWPLIAVAVGGVFGLIFHSWLIPVIVLGAVVVLMLLNRIRPNNYKLIARNVAGVYEYIQKNFAQVLGNEDLRLAYTGLVCATIHMEQGLITFTDIIAAVKYAKMHKVYLKGSSADVYGYDKETRSLLSFLKDEDLLLNFALNLITLELAADAMTPQMSPRDVLVATNTKKVEVYKTIQDVRNKGRTALGGLVNKVVASYDLNKVNEALADSQKSTEGKP